MFSLLLKIFFHRHLESVSTEHLWRWAKRIACFGVMVWCLPDCIPGIDETVATWLMVSVLWELNSRGELKAHWLSRGAIPRLLGSRPVKIDVDRPETND